MYYHKYNISMIWYPLVQFKDNKWHFDLIIYEEKLKQSFENYTKLFTLKSLELYSI